MINDDDCVVIMMMTEAGYKEYFKYQNPINAIETKFYMKPRKWNESKLKSAVMYTQ